jgi:lysophospholipase L1-like esterase
MADSRLGLGAKLALAAASVLLVFGAAEAGMRVLGLGEIMTYRADPRFGYLMEPGRTVTTWGVPVHINSLGLRGPELLDPKPADVIRVMFLGDSITYGGGRIPEDELFLRRVESLAKQKGFRVESVNASAPGWSPQNWAAWLKANGTMSADVVVAVVPTIDLRRPFATPAEHSLLEHQPLLRLTSIWQRLSGVGQPGVPLTREAGESNLRAVAEVASQLAPQPLLGVFVPSREKADGEAEVWAPYERQFPGALDLRGALQPSDFFDDVHLSLAGHRLVGERIWEYLAPRISELAAARAAVVR